MQSESLLTFGEYRLDAVSGHLYRGAVPVPLTPKAFALLQYLAAQPGGWCRSRSCSTPSGPACSSATRC